MIELKTAKELELMKQACKIAAIALQKGGEAVKIGISTIEIDRIIEKTILKLGAKPSFLGYGGFPASACISVNDEVIHGIPSNRKLLEGDIVSIDVGAYYNGYHGDNAATFPVGKVGEDAQKLMDITKQSLKEAIKVAVPGNRMGDISNAVQTYVENNGFAIVKDFVGHGIGKNLHESPDVPNFGTKGMGIRLVSGMTLAIEPMVNAIGEKVKVLPDGWTVKTLSGSLSAHFENTIVITDNGAEILTLA